MFDPRTNRWTTLPPLPLGRSAVAGAALDGHFLVIGGESPGESAVNTEVDSYDPRRKVWTRAPDLPAGRQGIGVAVVDGRVWVPGGGPTGGGSQQSASVYVLG